MKNMQIKPVSKKNRLRRRGGAEGGGE